MSTPRCSLHAALISLIQVNAAFAQDGLRSIEFETGEVTGASVTVSPDGEWLVFTILGHLFRLPVEGGEAEQLTFGPDYRFSERRSSGSWLSIAQSSSTS